MIQNKMGLGTIILQKMKEKAGVSVNIYSISTHLRTRSIEIYDR